MATKAQQKFLDFINETAMNLPGGWEVIQSWAGPHEGADLYLEDHRTGNLIAFTMADHRRFDWFFVLISNPNDDDHGRPRGSDFSQDARRGSANLIRTLEQVLESRRKHRYPYR